MPILLAKNLSPGVARTVHLVAFTPKPRLSKLEMTPAAAPTTRIGRREEPTVQFSLKPKLGVLLGFFANVLGKFPPNSHAWFVTRDSMQPDDRNGAKAPKDRPPRVLLIAGSNRRQYFTSVAKAPSYATSRW